MNKTKQILKAVIFALKNSGKVNEWTEMDKYYARLIPFEKRGKRMTRRDVDTTIVILESIYQFNIGCYRLDKHRMYGASGGI